MLFFISEQLDMKNQTHPMQPRIKSLVMTRYKETKIKLSMNEFVDENN